MGYADGVIRSGLEIVRKYLTNFQASFFCLLVTAFTGSWQQAASLRGSRRVIPALVTSLLPDTDQVVADGIFGKFKIRAFVR